ncbi:hypothetical protein [Thiolapillus sp.]|uniref:hypothetical protein n=1 Tax=Thiolapillus sp. TaxID=2017437 RepID=UPI003AF511AD
MFSLWRKARRENSAASRLLGSTSLRFALHGWQRLKVVKQEVIHLVIDDTLTLRASKKAPGSQIHHQHATSRIWRNM